MALEAKHIGNIKMARYRRITGDLETFETIELCTGKAELVYDPGRTRLRLAGCAIPVGIVRQSRSISRYSLA